MFLCYKTDYGIIGTNEYPEYCTCSARKVSFLIPSATVKCGDLTAAADNAIHINVFSVHESIPEAYINDIVNHDRNNISNLCKS
jgi:hypothetical protein